MSIIFTSGVKFVKKNRGQTNDLYIMETVNLVSLLYPLFFLRGMSLNHTIRNEGTFRLVRLWYPFFLAKRRRHSVVISSIRRRYLKTEDPVL